MFAVGDGKTASRAADILPGVKIALFFFDSRYSISKKLDEGRQLGHVWDQHAKPGATGHPHLHGWREDGAPDKEKEQHVASPLRFREETKMERGGYPRPSQMGVMCKL